jgi:hypothetical protein
MDPNLIPDILASYLFFVAMFIALRAFYIYNKARNPRLFVLGLSMGVIALTAAADFSSTNFTNGTLNTNWFLYVGQAVSLLFILLSFLSSSDRYLRGLMIVHVCCSALLFGLLLFSPSLPDFPSVAFRAGLSASRSFICFGIFFCYVFAFFKKETRFSFLMGLSFLLLALGYLILVQKYFVATPDVFDHAGDITRMVSLTILFITMLIG